MKKVIVKKTGKKDRGVFALRDFKKNEFILYVKNHWSETSDMLLIANDSLGF